MRRFEGGYLTLCHARGVPVRMHWATPAGAFLMGGMRFRPVEWALFAVIIVLHELAHAGAARALRLEVHSADLTPVGGHCVVEEPRSELAGALVAAAGPASHVVLCAASVLVMRAGAGVLPPAVLGAASTFGAANAFVAVLNLLPVPPLDGARAWKLVDLGLSAGWARLADGTRRARGALERRRRARRVGAGHLRPVGGEDGEEEPPRTVH